MASETINKIKELLGLKFDAPVTAPANPSGDAGQASAIFSFPVDGGSPVFVNCSDDGLADIDEADSVYTDAAMTTPYPDGTYKVTGTDFSFTVAGGIVSAVTDADSKGPGAPLEAPAQDTTTADMSAFKAEFGAMKTEFEGFKTAFATVQSEFAAAKETISKQDQALKGLVELVEKLAAPVASPVSQPSNFKNQNILEEIAIKKLEEMRPVEKYRFLKHNN